MLTLKGFRKLLRGCDPDAELVFQYADEVFVISNIIEQNESPDNYTVKPVVVVPLMKVSDINTKEDL